MVASKRSQHVSGQTSDRERQWLTKPQHLGETSEMPNLKRTLRGHSLSQTGTKVTAFKSTVLDFPTQMAGFTIFFTGERSIAAKRISMQLTSLKVLEIRSAFNGTKVTSREGNLIP
jgi:hypothetical protein